MRKANIWLRYLLIAIFMLAVVTIAYGYKSWHSATATMMTGSNQRTTKK